LNFLSIGLKFITCLPAGWGTFVLKLNQQAMRTQEIDRFAANLKLKLTIGERVLTGTLNDSTAGRDFASLLPLTVTLSDYHRIEKVSDLPQKLSIQDAPAGYKPTAGDITYYAPWGNLAIFYQDFPYAAGLVHLGKIDSGTEALHISQPFMATIEIGN
jgi:hypothetical protein